MKRFIHFNEEGEFTHSDIGVDSSCTWCWDNIQNYFVKGDKSYNLFKPDEEYFVSKFQTAPEKTHSGRIYA